MKNCKKCGSEKSLDEFPKSTKNKDGRESRCKSCSASERREKYAQNPEKYRNQTKAWAETNKDKIVEARRKYYYENPERTLELRAASNIRNKESTLARDRAWYAANSEYKIAKVKEWYEKNIDHARSAAKVRSKARYHANPELMSARAKVYRKKNPDGIAAQKRRYKASKLGAEGSHTGKDVQAIFEKQRGLCGNCKKKLFKSGAKKFHVDHVIPLSRGGGNGPDNLQCLCSSCNLRKGAKDPLDWARENGRLL